MRFQRLEIPAFGPFMNLDLQFRDQLRDLQVIYGANEAGKSSLLRAIRDLLFGIPAQSVDNFLHEYADLRIKGEIRNRAGAQLIFQRRKGNRNTLLDAEGKQLPDTALLPFLGSVDQAYFSTMFGLGARELREGAQQLLRGEGDIGTALFSASLGGTPVQQVVAALQEEADRLFKGRATANVSIRPTANRYKELIRQSREVMVSPEVWDKIDQELVKAGSDRKQLEDEISKLQLELGWIERCEDALPTVGRLGEERHKLAELPPLPAVTVDFISRAKTARQNACQAQAEVQRLNAHIEKLGAQLLECRTNPAVLAKAEVLDQLHQDLGVYRDRKKTLADLQVKLAGLEPQLHSGLRNLQLPGDFVSLNNRRLSVPAQLACEEAAQALQNAVQELAANADKAESIQSQISAKEADLQSLPETNLDDLREALTVAAEATEADRTLVVSETEVQRLTRETADLHRLVSGAPEDFEVTARLSVPALATIRGYHEQIKGIKLEMAAEEKEIKESQRRGAAIQAELARLQRQGELPTEEALRRAREHRDHGWNLVLADWKGSGAKEELIPGSPLEEAFPQAIVKADQIADKLRLQAEAVAQAEEKRFQLGEIEMQAAQTSQTVLKLQGNLAECQKSWVAEWSAGGIIPRSPLEMEEWRNQWNGFRERFDKLKTAQESLARKIRQIQTAKQRLATVLGKPEEKEYSLLFAAARKLVQDGERASGQRSEKAQQLRDLKSDLTKLEQGRARLNHAVTVSTEKWKSQCVSVGLPEGTSPEAGLALLQQRRDLLVKYDGWQEASNKSQITTEAIAQYEENVNELAGTLGIQGDTIEAIQSSLWKALTEARKSKARYDQLAEQIERANRELADAQGQATRSNQALDELVQLAGRTTVAELEPLLAHLEKRDTVQVQIEGLRNTLSGLARGQSVDDFVAKVRAENPDSLADRKLAASQAKRDKESALSAIRETEFRLNNEKQNLEKAGDAAADFRQQAESCAATLTQDGARYLRLRLATHLLQGQIERFRKENQGPLLRKSGEVFQAITRGAFSGLGADFDAEDLPVLVGVRPDQTRVPMDGLSDGSRDQLYLALRFAALDRHLQEHEPMPLILDDLLITCDDDRAKAILPQLGELAKRTQVFLFTHHEHLVALCHQMLGEGEWHLHRLTSGNSK
jgi:uncharacterized protein YhaN